MTEQGRYADNRLFDLPVDWEPVGDKVLETVTERSVSALIRPGAIDDLAQYYNRSGSYAGTLFLDVQPNDPYSIEAADLYAVTTLSMKLDALHGRLLLDEGDDRVAVQQRLRGLDASLGITELDRADGGSAATLGRMYDLHSQFRGLLAGDSSRWVTAAKLCARKRPRLFPVRDNLVCEYLAAGRPLKRGDGWPGDFSVDIQAYAFLMTHPAVIASLEDIRRELTGTVRLDERDLRLLDSALWMAALADRS